MNKYGSVRDDEERAAPQELDLEPGELSEEAVRCLRCL